MLPKFVTSIDIPPPAKASRRSYLKARRAVGEDLCADVTRRSVVGAGPLSYRFFEYAQGVFECVNDLRGVRQVILLSAIDSRKHLSLGIEVLSKKAETKLAALEKHLGEAGVRARNLVKVGIAPQVIAAMAEVDASPIIMGATGMSLFRDTLLGSTTADVMRYSKRPILIVRFEVLKKLGRVECRRVCLDMLGKILFATDFSEPSQRGPQPTEATETK